MTEALSFLGNAASEIDATFSAIIISPHHFRRTS